MQRDFLIQSLVLDSIEKLRDDHLPLWLHAILENGFVGFANMSEEELRRQCARRGLRLEDDLEEPAREEFDDDPDEDDEELNDFLALARPSGAHALSS
jgi:hypothetical protein